MLRKLLLLIFSISLGFYAAVAQEEAANDGQNAWTLKQCIDRAFEKNITVRQALLANEINDNNYLQSKLNTLPTISSNVSHNFNFSNSLDPTTFEFVNANTQSTRLSLSGNLTLFSGLEKVNAIKQADNNKKTSELQIDQAKNDIGLTITNFYLQILLNKEILSSANIQLNNSREQYKQTKELVDAGALPKGDLLDRDAQVAQTELAVVQAENAEALSRLALALVLQIENVDEFDVVVPSNLDDISLQMADGTAKTVYDYALDHQPSVKVSQAQLRGSEITLDRARGALYPTLSFSVSLTSNYFDAATQSLGTTVSDAPFGITSGGELVSPLAPIPTGSIRGPLSFGMQLEENFAKSVGFNLSIPIFTGWSRMTNVQNAKIGILQNRLQLQASRNQLKEDIYRAHTNASAALKTYNANKRNFDALKLSADNAEIRYKAGAINSLEYQTLQNNLTVAESDMIRAKYDFIFKLKVLDFYQGKPITLD